MIKSSLLFIYIFVLCSLVNGQESKAKIGNIRTEMTGHAMIIKYDIIGSSPEFCHKINFVVLDNMRNTICPDSAYGDVGSCVYEGDDKLIVWEIYKEFDVIYGDFTPRLTIDAGDNRRQMRGAEYALLSLALPGLGDYFVADAKEMKLKPWHKTAFTAGVLGLSWATYRNRLEIPPVMAPPGWYLSADGTAEEPLIYIDHEWMKKPATTEPWLFPYDAEVFLGIGIASWLFDVIWVARRGSENSRVQNQALEHLSLAPGNQGVMLSYNKQF